MTPVAPAGTTHAESVASSSTRRVGPRGSTSRAVAYAAIAAYFGTPLLAAIVATLFLNLVGCGPSAIQVNAAAADTTSKLVNAGTGELETEFKRRQKQAVEDACGTTDPAGAEGQCRSEAREGAHRIRDRWEPVWATHDQVNELLDIYRETIQLAAAGDLDDPWRWARLASRVAAAYVELVEAAAAVDVRLPPLPGLLEQAAALGKVE